MDDLNRYICKVCGHSSFVEWEQHRTNANLTRPVETSSIVCLVCSLPEDFSETDKLVSESETTSRRVV